MCCIVQYGTSNTKETSKLQEEWYPYADFKGILKSKVKDDLYVEEVEFVKITITKEKGKKPQYTFTRLGQYEEMKELVELFKVPDYFEDKDYSFLNS